jgi:hypothetical protein
VLSWTRLVDHISNKDGQYEQKQESELGWIVFSVIEDDSFFESFIADSPSRSSIINRPVEAKRSD